MGDSVAVGADHIPRGGPGLLGAMRSDRIAEHGGEAVAADAEVARLHAKNMPSSANRGKSAKKEQGKTAMKAKATGKKAPTKRSKPRKTARRRR